MDSQKPSAEKCPESSPWTPESMVEVRSSFLLLSTKMCLNSQLRTAKWTPTLTEQTGSQRCSNSMLEICTSCSPRWHRHTLQALMLQETARQTGKTQSFSRQRVTAHSTLPWATDANFSSTEQRLLSSTWALSLRLRADQHQTLLTFTWRLTPNSCHTTTLSVSRWRTTSWLTRWLVTRWIDFMKVSCSDLAGPCTPRETTHTTRLTCMMLWCTTQLMWVCNGND